MAEQGRSIGPVLCWEPRNEGLETVLVPRVAGELLETSHSIRIQNVLDKGNARDGALNVEKNKIRSAPFLAVERRVGHIAGCGRAIAVKGGEERKFSTNNRIQLVVKLGGGDGLGLVQLSAMVFSDMKTLRWRSGETRNVAMVFC